MKSADTSLGDLFSRAHTKASLFLVALPSVLVQAGPPVVTRAYEAPKSGYRIIVVEQDGKETYYWGRPGNDLFFEELPSEKPKIEQSGKAQSTTFSIPVQDRPTIRTGKFEPTRAELEALYGNQSQARADFKEVLKSPTLALRLMGKAGDSEFSIKSGEREMVFKPEPSLVTAVNRGISQKHTVFSSAPLKRETVANIVSQPESNQQDFVMIEMVTLPDGVFWQVVDIDMKTGKSTTRFASHAEVEGQNLWSTTDGKKYAAKLYRDPNTGEIYGSAAKAEGNSGAQMVVISPHNSAKFEGSLRSLGVLYDANDCGLIVRLFAED